MKKALIIIGIALFFSVLILPAKSKINDLKNTETVISTDYVAAADSSQCPKSNAEKKACCKKNVQKACCKKDAEKKSCTRKK